jgi:fucokinase
LGPNHGVFQVDADTGSADPAARAGGTKRVVRFWQKASVSDLQRAGAVNAANDTVLLDSGLIYFSPRASATLLDLAQASAFAGCTYRCADLPLPVPSALLQRLRLAEGSAQAASLVPVPMRLELYSDILYALNGGTGMTHGAYMDSPADSPLPPATAASAGDSAYGCLAACEAELAAWVRERSRAALVSARTELWRRLTDIRFFACVADGGSFAHVGTTAEYLQLLSQPSEEQQRYGLKSRAACFVDQAAAEATSADALGSSSLVIMNSCVSVAALKPAISARASITGTVVEHCNLLLGTDAASNHHPFLLGDGCLVSGVRHPLPLHTLRDGMALQQIALVAAESRDDTARPFVFTLIGVTDPIKEACTKPSARLCGAGWNCLWERAGVTAADVWPSTAADASMNIWNAQLFPVVWQKENGELTLPSAPSATSVDVARACLWLQFLAPSGRADADSARLLEPAIISLWKNARRLSLREILAEASATAEFEWRRSLEGAAAAHYIAEKVATRSNAPLAPILRQLGTGPLETAKKALSLLDRLTATASADVAGRALSVTAALLWSIAQWGCHRHRSGPAGHHDWVAAIGRLRSPATRPAGTQALAALRDEWIERGPHHTGRAARYYEGAAQSLTAQCVETAAVDKPHPVAAPAPIGKWVIATCPARVDLSGGWSDTPPVMYEATTTDLLSAPYQPRKTGDAADSSSLATVSKVVRQFGGGFVVNAAVLVDGVRPLGARVRRTLEPTITIRTRADVEVSGLMGVAAEVADDDSAPGKVISSLVISSLSDLEDYCRPDAPGSLVKCALLLTGIVSLSPVPANANGTSGGFLSPRSGLAEMLGSLGAAKNDGGCGIEIETWSMLPHGSGLGGSSILAAAILAALSRAVLGAEYTRQELVHAVLRLEQLLTSGGGYQDNVGGVYPGVKASYCLPVLPLTVDVCALAVCCGSSNTNKQSRFVGDEELFQNADPRATERVCKFLDDHLFLVYTGKTRLAKDLLQRVLRQWAVRENGVTQTVEALRSNALEMAAAILATDAAATGAALDRYWVQKQAMAPNAEPAYVTSIISALREYGLIHGCTLAGAGGGGFLIGFSKTPCAIDEVRNVLSSHRLTASLGCTVHSAVVDQSGLVVETLYQ